MTSLSDTTTSRPQSPSVRVTVISHSPDGASESSAVIFPSLHDEASSVRSAPPAESVSAPSAPKKKPSIVSVSPSSEAEFTTGDGALSAFSTLSLPPVSILSFIDGIFTVPPIIRARSSSGVSSGRIAASSARLPAAAGEAIEVPSM